MYRLKVPLTTFVVIFVLVDMVGGFHMWESGWPKRITFTSDQPGIGQVHVARIPFTGFDWLILVLVISIHAVLFYLVWKGWRSQSVRLCSKPSNELPCRIAATRMRMKIRYMAPKAACARPSGS
jgi:hypothetical protein